MLGNIPMETSLLSLQALPLILLLIFHISNVITFSQSTSNNNVTDFSCSSNYSISCNTYVIYRTQSPGFLDPGNVSDLFAVSRRSLLKANNLPSLEVSFLPDQLILVPISCGCTGNQSFANITYQIKGGDSFFLVSIQTFENLTNYFVVEALNPKLEPTKLMPGQEVIFPLFCKCPTKTQLDQGLNFLITYVWQAGDDVSELSRKMNSSSEALVAVNNHRNFSAAALHPILIPVSEPPVLPHGLYNATPSVDERPKSAGRIIFIVIGIVCAVLALSVGCWIVLCCSKGYRKKVLARTGSSLEAIDLLRSKKPSIVEAFSPRTRVDKVLPGVSQYLDKLVVYETKAIMDATLDLDERFRVGGSVYRVALDGQVLAVKQAKGDVSEELKILQKVNHANLVKLAGVSASKDDGIFFLLYQYADNGSLDKWLYPEPPQKSSKSSGSVNFLSWRQRLNIALDVANGLQYMHDHTRPSIVHGDIRASNIVLKANLKAMISNFSMAKPATDSVTPATDVFAFGVLLLELLSGKRREGDEEVGILMLEAEEKREERLREWMDPNLESSFPMDGALSLAGLARMCTLETPSERPGTTEIVFTLSVLAHSSTDAFERSGTSNFEESIQIINPPVAR